MDALKFIIGFPVVLLCIAFPTFLIAIVVTIAIIGILKEDANDKKGG